MNNYIESHDLTENDYIYGNIIFKNQDKELPDNFCLDCNKVEHQLWSEMCVGFGISTVVENIMKCQYNKVIPDLSPMFLYSESKAVDGYPDRGGTVIKTALKVLIQKGICEETYYPFMDNKNTKVNIFPAKNEKVYKNALQYKPSGGYAKISTLNELKRAIYHHNGVVAGLRVFSNFNNTLDGWMRKPPSSEEYSGNHCMTFIGWDDNVTKNINGIKYKGAFKIANSYGERSGYDGYFYLPYDGLNWHGKYSKDNLVGEMWCIYNEKDVINNRYHIQKNIDPNIYSRTIQMKIGDKIAYIDAQPYKLVIPPIIVNGTTFIPLRFVSESFKADIRFVSNDKRIIIYDKERQVCLEMKIGDKLAKNGNKDYIMLEAPFVKDNTTYVGIRAVSECLGLNTSYDPKNKSILIKE